MGKKDETKLIGQKFGILTVISYHGKRNGRYYWNTICSCENETVKPVREDALKGGYTKSCGCKAPHTNGPNKSVLPKVDLTGRSFGRLIVISFHSWDCKGTRRRAIWLCQCTCLKNKKVTVRSDSLTEGNTKSCGCLKEENKSGGRRPQEQPIEDLTGKKYGRLAVLEFGYKRNNKFYWLARCECGKVDCYRHDKLKDNHTKSCGCLAKENKGPKAKEDREVKVLNDHYGKYKCKDNFELEYARFVIMVKEKCFYCKEIDIKKDKYTGMEFEVNGIDRLDNAKGYTLDNVVPCCKTCNYMKGSYSLERFVEGIMDINHHNEFIHKNFRTESILRKDFLTNKTFEVHFQRFFNSTKQGAVRRGLTFQLSEEHVLKLIVKQCEYCGMYNGMTNDGHWVNGIDRMDNFEGYTIGNSVSSCTFCNMAKHKKSVNEFITHVQKLLPFAETFIEKGNLS
ncbi:hypothetical protein ACIQD3_21940 [Peribacillus loiseleuriae]|uniref:hypothetical protein n=1 Tax=Peribacillus loiseleuriae TaxID=1679170 RepID=UPI00381B4253